MNLDNIKISVIGLGYVGYPLFELFSRQYDCIGLDISVQVVKRLREKDSVIRRFANSAKSSFIPQFTNQYKDVADCDIFIVTVPTPVDKNSKPDLSLLTTACHQVASIMKKNCMVVFESTVAPGTIDELCIPLLEQESGMQINKDFYVGYSPERINVGDNLHNTANTAKVVSASSEYALDVLYKLYASVIDAQIVKASSIKVAEASKMYENVQRDVLIALANEYSKFCQSEGINIREVTKCASTKWNFAQAYPGLVGGHCIGVDPYYVIDRAQTNGIDLSLIKKAREINEQSVVNSAGRFIKRVNDDFGSTKSLNLLILGFSYKQDVGDIRNTKIAKFVELVAPEFSKVDCYDALVDRQAAKEEYNINILTNLDELQASYDVTIKMLNHTCFDDININFGHFFLLEQFL